MRELTGVRGDRERPICLGRWGQVLGIFVYIRTTTRAAVYLVLGTKKPLNSSTPMFLVTTYLKRKGVHSSVLYR